MLFSMPFNVIPPAIYFHFCFSKVDLAHLKNILFFILFFSRGILYILLNSVANDKTVSLNIVPSFKMKILIAFWSSNLVFKFEDFISQFRSILQNWSFTRTVNSIKLITTVMRLMTWYSNMAFLFQVASLFGINESVVSKLYFLSLYYCYFLNLILIIHVRNKLDRTGIYPSKFMKLRSFSDILSFN